MRIKITNVITHHKFKFSNAFDQYNGVFIKNK